MSDAPLTAAEKAELDRLQMVVNAAQASDEERERMRALKRRLIASANKS